jgi:hypothetical protein
MERFKRHPPYRAKDSESAKEIKRELRDSFSVECSTLTPVTLPIIPEAPPA